jgi:hypothetical protein
MSNGKNTVSKSSRKESKTASSTKPQSSETLTSSSSPVQLESTRALLTWLRQAFLANHSALQARKEAKTTKGTSGRKRSNVFASYDPDTRSWRTSQVCLILDTLAKSSLRWPKSGSMRDGLCSEQTTWEPRTYAKGSGFWRTPSAQEPGVTVKRLVTKDGDPPTLGQRLYDKETGRLAQVGLTQQVKMCKTPSAADAYTGNMKKKEFKFGNSGSLAQEVESGFLETHRKWPTPAARDRHTPQGERVEKNGMGGYILRKKSKPDNTFGAGLADAVEFEEKKMWPTPNASDNRDRGNMSDPAIQRRIAKGKQIGLSMAVKETKGGGSLNPTWVEWLMGWPLGWTDLNPLETDKYQQWLQQHGKY